MSVDVAIVQTKPRKGDLNGNFERLSGVFREIIAAGVPDLIVLPEAAMTGYFLEGAVYELALPAQTFAERLNAAWRAVGGGASVDVACGFFENAEGTYYARLGAGEPQIVHVHHKMFLPTYGVFDEERFLSRGRRLSVFPTPFGRAAILICEDAWHAIMPTIAALKGARMIIVPSASPGRGLGGDGTLESVAHWRRMLTTFAAEHGVYVLYAGLTGFEGGKGMSGSSCIVSPRGEVLTCTDELAVTVVRASLDPAEIDLARATLPLLGDLGSVLPDLWYDDELPLPRAAAARTEVSDGAGR
jgi:N-carbamoylputrescine amidase